MSAAMDTGADGKREATGAAVGGAKGQASTPPGAPRDAVETDRIAAYLQPLAKDMLFDELSDAYLQKAGLADILQGVPVPISLQDGKLTTLDIARDMAFLLGCDPAFPHRDAYIAYIRRMFGESILPAILNEGVETAQKGDYLRACVWFRAAMVLDAQNADALYCYGRACRDAYACEEGGEDEEKVGRFKAESLEAFERLTLLKPDFADGYYFLGYGYVNLGLYLKAKLTWETYLQLTGGADESEKTVREKREEIGERLAALADPVEIETGYNHVLAGRYGEGIRVLSRYEEGRFADWWPLWYYLGVAHAGLGETETAIDCLRRALALSPSNSQVMEALIACYEEMGDAEKVEKYRNKLRLIDENRALDRAEK